jgi:hypothetical protein
MNQLSSFRLLWISQSIANLGDSLYILAIVTFIYIILVQLPLQDCFLFCEYVHMAEWIVSTIDYRSFSA